VTTDDEDGYTIGRRLRLLRHARGKSLAVIAGLAGISESYLSMLERGERVLDRRSLIVALANALRVAPSELTLLPVPAPGDGVADAAVDALRVAMQAVSLGVPDSQVQPVEQLSARVHAVLDAKQRCRHAEVGMVLPGLIRDLHTSINAGREDAELLRLAVALHTQGTQAFLHGVGAPSDLCWAAARLGAERRQHRRHHHRHRRVRDGEQPGRRDPGRHLVLRARRVGNPAPAGQARVTGRDRPS